MKYITCIFIYTVMQSCLTCLSYYTSEKSHRDLTLSTNELNISCTTPFGNDEDLILLIWFNDRFPEKNIEFINVNIITDNNNVLRLNNINLSSTKIKSNTLFDHKYTVNDFNDLPKNDRRTKIENESVRYVFKFKPTLLVNKIKVFYFIKFEDGEVIQGYEDLIKAKSCRFMIH